MKEDPVIGCVNGGSNDGDELLSTTSMFSIVRLSRSFRLSVALPSTIPCLKLLNEPASAPARE